MPLLKIYLAVLAFYLIVISISSQRHPTLNDLLWLEGSLVECMTSVAYLATVIISIVAYARHRSPVLIATFITALLCMASEMSLLLTVLKDRTPDVPVGEGKVFLDAPHDLIKLAYLNVFVERSIVWIIGLAVLFVAVALVSHVLLRQSLTWRSLLLTPESILFFVLFITAGLIATIMDLEIFAPTSSAPVEESLELWAALALLFGVGALRSSSNVNRSSSRNLRHLYRDKSIHSEVPAIASSSVSDGNG